MCGKPQLAAYPDAKELTVVSGNHQLRSKPRRTELCFEDATARGLFPSNERQLKAIEDLKALVAEDHLLAIPDKKAAIEAANARLRSEPAAGLPDMKPWCRKWSDWRAEN